MKENSIEDKIEEKYTRYLNCKTDILELTIEEAMFILEKDRKNRYVEELLQEAYKVILTDYKRVLKENEELKDDIENISDENEVLKEENEGLKAKNKILEELLQGNLYELYKYYKELAGSYQGNCIPVQKIKDKIKELKQLEFNGDLVTQSTAILTTICILQELLESEE